MEVLGSARSKTTPADRARISCRLGAKAVEVGEGDDLALQADIVLSGGANQYELRKRGVAWLEVNHGRDFALSGYDGALALLERIDRELTSPVWRNALLPAPWQTARPAKILAD